MKGEKAQGKGPRSSQRQEKKKRLNVLEPSLQKNVAAAHTEVQHNTYKQQPSILNTKTANTNIPKHKA